MSCTSCGGKSRRPLRTTGGRPVQQTPVGNRLPRGENTRRIVTGLRWKGN
ncbi:TPA: hypothetical protein SLO96_003017 [Proteus mirabilis]|nr:hypothetical protein [Proteus mirabilis]